MTHLPPPRPPPRWSVRATWRARPRGPTSTKPTPTTPLSSTPPWPKPPSGASTTGSSSSASPPSASPSPSPSPSPPPSSSSPPTPPPLENTGSVDADNSGGPHWYRFGAFRFVFAANANKRCNNSKGEERESETHNANLQRKLSEICDFEAQKRKKEMEERQPLCFVGGRRRWSLHALEGLFRSWPVSSLLPRSWPVSSLSSARIYMSIGAPV